MAQIKDIGRELVAARRTLGVTQRELGARVGVTQPQIARWEASGYRSASLERVSQVAEELGYEVSAASTMLAAEQHVAYRVSVPGADPDALDALHRLSAPPEAIAAFARSHSIERLDLFGSVLTERFGAGSDVDVLVTYAPGETPSLLGMADHETELAALLRRRVDLVSRAAVETSSNIVRRSEILESARTLYARP